MIWKPLFCNVVSMLVEESYDYPRAGEVTLKMGVIRPVPNQKTRQSTNCVLGRIINSNNVNSANACKSFWYDKWQLTTSTLSWCGGRYPLTQ